MKRSFRIIFAWALILYLSILQPVSIHAADTGSQNSDLDYLKSVIEMIQEKYGGEISEQQLIEGAVRGMFSTMDPYTTYFSKEEASNFMGDINGMYEGIGISMEMKTGYVEVTKVFGSSPAEKAGIIAGDKIVSVDGKKVEGSSLQEVGNMIKGPSDTIVELGIMRGSTGEIKKLEVLRGKVTLNPVSYRIEGDIGYIRLEIFNANAGWFMIQALNDMDSNNIKKIILDLRGNPGGDVSQAVAVARQFVPKGLITKLDFKSESINDQEYYSYLKEPKYKLAVLVNEMSASASEILAGAIQDTGVGTLIGKNTFGKAKVQNIIPILTPEAYEKYKKELGVDVVSAFDLIYVYGISPLDSEIAGYTKITTGVYTTPKGRMIDLKGLKPDIEVDDPVQPNDVNIFNIERLRKVSKPVLYDESQDIYNAEKILKALGYDVDEADSIMDKKTVEAVKKFQKEKGGYPHGGLDFTTQQWLNDELDKLVREADGQYAKAVELLDGPER